MVARLSASRSTPRETQPCVRAQCLGRRVMESQVPSAIPGDEVRVVASGVSLIAGIGRNSMGRAVFKSLVPSRSMGVWTSPRRSLMVGRPVLNCMGRCKKEG